MSATSESPPNGQRRRRNPRARPFVVKMQRPIIGDMVLIYDRTRRVDCQLPWTDEIARCFGEGVLKVYCKVRLVGTILHIEDQVPDQDW